MTRLRSLAGALLIGLPTAVVAHVLTYGRGHILGGSHHEEVVELTLTLATAAIVAAGTLALASARTAQNGSILAARLSAYLPGWGTLCLAAAGWFGLIEGLEPQHQLALAVTGLAIAASAWIFGSIARAALAALAQVAFAIFAAQPAARRVGGIRLQAEPVLVRSRITDHRRFARPPPSLA